MNVDGGQHIWAHTRDFKWQSALFWRVLDMGKGYGLWALTGDLKLLRALALRILIRGLIVIISLFSLSPYIRTFPLCNPIFID